MREVTGLTVTIGGGTSKSVAKIASQHAKPDGLLLVPPGTEEAFLAPLDVSMLWGVGPVTTAMLNRAGIHTIAHLAARDQDWLRKVLGARGPEMQRRARGQDQEPVVPTRETKSVSAETTLAQDISDASTLQTELAQLSRRVVERIQAGDLQGRTVSVKLRLADFTTFTRQSTLDSPTSDPAMIAAAADALLLREIAPGRRFRLLGVGVSNFAEMLQQPSSRRRKAEVCLLGRLAIDRRGGVEEVPAKPVGHLVVNAGQPLGGGTLKDQCVLLHQP